MPAGAIGLVGMGSVLAATVHSPLLAIILVFEISLNHSILPALMVACAVSTLVGRALHRESVYTEPLDRKGVKLEPESTQVGAAMQQTVGDLMRSPVPPLRETTKFRQIADRFLTSPNNYLPVVDNQQRLLGVVVLHDLKEHLHVGVELASVIAFDIMRPIPVALTPNQGLVSVLPTVLATEIRDIPVVNNLTEYRLVGTLMRSEALGVLSEAISIHSTARS
jgi:CIC family chloride channel protein